MFIGKEKTDSGLEEKLAKCPSCGRTSMNIKLCLCFLGNKKIVYSESNMSGNGSGTQTEATMNRLFQSGDHMNFCAHRTGGSVSQSRCHWGRPRVRRTQQGHLLEAEMLSSLQESQLRVGVLRSMPS